MVLETTTRVGDGSLMTVNHLDLSDRWGPDRSVGQGRPEGFGRGYNCGSRGILRMAGALLVLVLLALLAKDTLDLGHSRCARAGLALCGLDQRLGSSSSSLGRDTVLVPWRSRKFSLELWTRLQIIQRMPPLERSRALLLTTSASQWTLDIRNRRRSLLLLLVGRSHGICIAGIEEGGDAGKRKALLGRPA